MNNPAIKHTLVSQAHLSDGQHWHAR